MNAPRPNRPSVDQSEVENLRNLHEPHDDVPRGRVWSPSPEDKRPLRSAPEHELPPFIPQRLSQPQNEAQAQLAQNVYEDRGEVPPQMQQKQTRELPPDFDPEVDDENDEYVGMAGMHSQPSQMHRNESHISKPALRTMEQRTQQQAKPALTEHPVLQRLRESFGLKAKEVRTKKIGPFVFAFRKYSTQAYIQFVSNNLRPNVLSDAELMEKIGYAIASISIASIDGVPTHEVFGTSIDPLLEKPLVNADPLHPPTSVVVNTALMLFPWLNGLAIPELGDTLVDAYSELFPKEQLVKAKGIWKFVCPKRNCNETMERKPRYKDVNGTNVLKPYYCPVHGVHMQGLGSLEDLADFPLV